MTSEKQAEAEQYAAVRELEGARERLYWKIRDSRSHMEMKRDAQEAFAEYDEVVRETERAKYERLRDAATRLADTAAKPSFPGYMAEDFEQAFKDTRAALADIVQP